MTTRTTFFNLRAVGSYANMADAIDALRERLWQCARR